MKISINNLSEGLMDINAGTAAQDITAADILELDSFRGFSEEQAQNLAATIKTFTQVVFMVCTNSKTA